MTSSLNFHCMRKKVETLGNIPENPCGGAYNMVKNRIYKHKESMKEVILQKFP